MIRVFALYVALAALAACTGNQNSGVAPDAPPPADTSTGVSISGEATFGVVYRGD